MYCPANFQEDRTDVLLGLLEQHPLATIITAGSDGLTADHIPLMHEPVAGMPGKLIGHVAKNNPLWQAPPQQDHLVVFQGPSTYISPNWYATKAESGKVVPTWNYAVVHVHATLVTHHDPQAILSILNKLTSCHEAAQQPKPWQVADAPAEFTDQLVKHIVGIELHIERMQGKWKVSQNQIPANQRGVIDGLHALQSDAASRMAALVQQFGK
ncbi:MAG TPA: FMN-binding negative transcriptional regulator [Burkholderiaceae bacterium]